MERSASKNLLITNALGGAVRRIGNLRRSLAPVQRELARRAVWLAVLYGIAQVAGLREWASALLKGSASSIVERIGCLVYLFLYGSFIFIVPTLVIATLLLIAWDLLSRKKSRRKRNCI